MSTDVFSKVTVAAPTRDQQASMVARVLVSEWFYKYGVPSRIHSDQGRSFGSSLLQQLCSLYRVARSRTTPCHPAGNGQCDRTLHNLLCTLPPSRKRDWASCLPRCFSVITPHHIRALVSHLSSLCLARNLGFRSIFCWVKFRSLYLGRCRIGLPNIRRGLEWHFRVLMSNCWLLLTGRRKGMIGRSGMHPSLWASRCI